VLHLFGIEGVKAVFYGPDFVTKTKDAKNPWSESVLKLEVYSVLMEHLSAATADSPGAGWQTATVPVGGQGQRGPAGYAFWKQTRRRWRRSRSCWTRACGLPSRKDGGDIEHFEFTDEGIVRLKLNC